MLKSFMTKSIMAVSVAAVVATVTTFLTTVVPQAKADAQMSVAFEHFSFQADPLPAPVSGSACSHSWPDYEQSCQFDLRKTANQARAIRVIAVR
jgi:hypothetical protein